MDQRTCIIAAKQLSERRRALAALGRAKVFETKLERTLDTPKVALLDRGFQLTHHLKVAMARGLLGTQHRLRAQLQLAHMAADPHHHLEVHVAARKRLLVAVVELEDIFLWQAGDHRVDPSVHRANIGVGDGGAHDVGEAIPCNAATLGVAVLEQGFHARPSLALDGGHDRSPARRVRDPIYELFKRVMRHPGLCVELGESAHKPLMDKQRRVAYAVLVIAWQ